MSVFYSCKLLNSAMKNKVEERSLSTEWEMGKICLNCFTRMIIMHFVSRMNEISVLNLHFTIPI